MQTKDEKIIMFKKRFLENLGETFNQMSQNKWKIYYEIENDEFTWVNPEQSPSEKSLLFSIDDFLSMSVNKETAKIEYFSIQDFKSTYIKKNPELKKFAKVITINNDHINIAQQKNALKELIGGLFTESLVLQYNCLPA